MLHAAFKYAVISWNFASKPTFGFSEHTH